MGDTANRPAAGVLLTSSSGNILLTRRVDDGHYWSVPGGGIEEGETPDAAARRELLEETGLDYTGPLHQLSRRVKDGVDFTTFGATVEDEFKPALNKEHDLARWIEPKQAMSEGGLHPGLKTTLEMPYMNELDVAKAIRDKELTSPVTVGTFLLVNMRITGTGAAYRKALNEYVWRDPSLYMTDEFLERCNGLPVILDHPPNGNLDSKEFAERAVGTIVLPFRDEAAKEIWGIAKVYDDAAKKLILEGKMSTSPAVVFTNGQGTKHPMPDGHHILIENEPSIIDHVALCEAGVWDKGGPPTGVESITANAEPIKSTLTDSQIEDTAMADEKTAKDASMPMNSKEGEALDKILAHMDGIHKRLDAVEAKEKEREDKARKDAEEKAAGEKEFARKDGESDEEYEGRKKEDKAKKDAAKKDADEKEEKERKDAAEKAEKEKQSMKEDSVRQDSVAALHAELADIKKRLPVELTEADRKQYVDAQVRADSVAQMFGTSAPRWVHGETVLQYRRRLLRNFQEHSATWKGVDISQINDSVAIDNIEKQIFADAEHAAKNPVTDGKGSLRAITTTDSAGRRITKFYGDNSVTWAPFQPQVVRNIVGFYRNDSNRS